jgi:hypothetical protein
MPNPFALQGAATDQSHYAPLLQNRIFTGIWTNRSPLRDAATTFVEERYYGARQDSIIDGLNSEITSKLTLKRRAGTSVYNSANFPPINRFYSFNTFTLTTEVIHVMADTASVVYDATGPSTASPIFTKSSGAKSTYFLGVGNTLYMTNGVDNVQWNPATNVVGPWGIPAPVNAPNVSQTVRHNPYSAWAASTVFCQSSIAPGALLIKDPNGNMQMCFLGGTTGSSIPATWHTSVLSGPTVDGGVHWNYMGSANWIANWVYGAGLEAVSATVNVSTGTQQMNFVCIQSGTSGALTPNWPSGVGATVADGTTIWMNVGLTLEWANIGPSQLVVLLFGNQIIDPNGYQQTVFQAGKTSSTVPTFQGQVGALTTDNGVIWQNAGPFAPAATGTVQYGYAYKDSATSDLSNMSPASAPILVQLGNEVTVQGVGPTTAQGDTIYIYRTAQGGSLFLYLAQIASPGVNQPWTYVDTLPDTALTPTLQAAVAGENTPLPAGATCMAYHLQRIFAAVGNVVYFSTGPDAVVTGGNGNSGFSPINTFTCQSRITRFWTTSVGLVVFTVRDAYIILLDQGSGISSSASSLYMTTYIEGLPLLNYDAFSVNKTVAYLMTGQRMVLSLEASAGIVEVSFPIADRMMAFDPTTTDVTWHSESSGETALYVANGGSWWRFAATSAPETGFNWSPMATIKGAPTCVQSVEVSPGQWRLLTGPGAGGGPIAYRDVNASTDTGTAFAAYTTFGSILLAAPGQLGGLAFITLESSRVGTPSALSVMLGEIGLPGTFESLRRTRQDPPNLPPSVSLYSDRFSILQNQQPAWCRHFQMRVDWPAEDAANELLGFTIFGQTWQEYRSQ